MPPAGYEKDVVLLQISQKKKKEEVANTDWHRSPQLRPRISVTLNQNKYFHYYTLLWFVFMTKY